MLTRKQQELLLFIQQHLSQGGVSPSFDEMKDALGLKSKSGIHRLITGLEERGFIRRLPHRARALEVVKLPEGVGGDTGHRDVAPREHASREFSPRESSMARDLSGHSPPAMAGAPVPVPAAPAREAPASARFQPNIIQGTFGTTLTGRNLPPGADTVALPFYGRIAAGTPIEALADTSNFIDIPAGLLSAGEHYALQVAGDSMVGAGILDGDTVIIQRCDSAENGTIIVALVEESEVTLKRLRRKGQTVALEPVNPEYETRIFGADRVRVQGRLVGLMRKY